jgi:5-methyltetrahydrofolate--homocysteine methyltransferase
LRYLGYKGSLPGDNIQKIIDECEAELLSAIEPRYIYHAFDIVRRTEKLLLDGCNISLDGKDIKNHLDGCDRAVLFCSTLSAGADRLIRTAQLEDMTRAVIINSLASVAIEQVCDFAESEIRKEYPESFMTWRFSPGYGDFPIEIQGDFLNVLNAPKRIGLTATESSILIPKKSVTAIIGLSDKPIEQKKRGCQTCNLRETCNFRKRGEHCGF